MSDEQSCAEVTEAASALGAERMVVGHNIVPWISSRCGGRLQLIDVGMSYAYGGQPAAWRCSLADDGTATVRALYEGAQEAQEAQEEPPPELCARCASTSPHSQEGSDCDNYCDRAPRRRRAL